MDVNASLATRAYVNARAQTAPGPDAGDHPARSLAREFAAVLQAGDHTARAAMTGHADPHTLVQALSATELAVETAVTLRDKVVEAYQEILRMPV